MYKTVKELRREAERYNAAGTVLGVAAMAAFALFLAYLNGSGWSTGSVLSMIGAVVCGGLSADAFVSAAGCEVQAEEREK